MNYRCPVCLFKSLPYPPADYHICPCCGTEFGNDDDNYSHAQLREMWVASGAYWFFGKAPVGWNPWLQLMEGGRPELVPKITVKLVTAENIQGKNLYFSDEPILQVGTGAYATAY